MILKIDVDLLMWLSWLFTLISLYLVVCSFSLLYCLLNLYCVEQTLRNDYFISSLNVSAFQDHWTCRIAGSAKAMEFFDLDEGTCVLSLSKPLLDDTDNTNPYHV